MTCQTQFKDYEEQAMATITLIKQMKKDKEATEDKVKMGIKCILIIIGAQWEWMKEKMEECSAAIWS